MFDPELEHGPRWVGPPPSPEKPFQVTVRSPEPKALPEEEEVEQEEFEEEELPLSLEEIEAAYLAALETAELVDHAVSEAVDDASTESADEEAIYDSEEVDFGVPVDDFAEPHFADDPPESISESKVNQAESLTSEIPSAPVVQSDELTPVCDATADLSASSELNRDSTDEVSPAESASPPVKASPAERSRDYLTADDDEERPITTREVVEALLFVGGEPLPTKKILDLVGGSLTVEQLEQLLTDLNSTYLNEGRPYQVRLQTGGYVISLREEFETVRSRAFGQGPKEVKLAQDALEVLALVAYQQPATREALEEMGRPNLGPVLRQLLRRQLVCLERREGEAEALYRTTPRFLSLFGLQSLDDLPQAGDFNFK